MTSEEIASTIGVVRGHKLHLVIAMHTRLYARVLEKPDCNLLPFSKKQNKNGGKIDKIREFYAFGSSPTFSRWDYALTVMA
jgi:hypothetical protein